MAGARSGACLQPRGIGDFARRKGMDPSRDPGRSRRDPGLGGGKQKPRWTRNLESWRPDRTLESLAGLRLDAGCLQNVERDTFKLRLDKKEREEASKLVMLTRITSEVISSSSANCTKLDFQFSPMELLNPAASGDVCNGSTPEGKPSPFNPEVLNMTAEELRLRYLGPRRSGFFVPVCTTYLLIFVVGALGNLMTCLVIIQHRFMRTPTNYYLFSLAISDLLVLLLGMPLEIYEMWSNYPFLLGAGGCCFKTLLFEAVCFASILNVTALSVERYIAVVHPLKAKYVVTKNHTQKVIVTLWVLSIVCSIPNTSLHGLQTLYVPGWGVVPDSDTCTLVKSPLIYNLLIQITTVIFFFIPMAIISVLYLLIGLQLRKEKLLEALEAKSGSWSDYHNVRLQQKKARRRQERRDEHRSSPLSAGPSSCCSRSSRHPCGIISTHSHPSIKIAQQ
ncbi:neuromedin-U receptor 1 isoform X3 [Crotalus tigris]|uniref:neuromedin-U receptor 1 isoform X3 n=1 Tax=Crotalus tigris TaxID=88082 RepID=UPI00192F2555|nr:neuromedin-U receptor 1 isoform X3 [Crotalus tigris]